MKLEILFLGKTKKSFLAAGIDEYNKRLRHYVPLEIKVLKEKQWKKTSSISAITEEESRLLLEAKSKSSMLVVLDRKGSHVDSEGFANMLSKWEDNGLKGVSFVIGGPLGLATSIINKAAHVISLSQMTFTHEMSRLILLEQLYRAYTIKEGQRYHK